MLAYFLYSTQKALISIVTSSCPEHDTDKNLVLFSGIACSPDLDNNTK